MRSQLETAPGQWGVNADAPGGKGMEKDEKAKKNWEK